MKINKLQQGNYFKTKEVRPLGNYYVWKDKNSNDPWNTVFPDGLSRVRDNNGEIQLEVGETLPELNVSGESLYSKFMKRYKNQELWEDIKIQNNYYNRFNRDMKLNRLNPYLQQQDSLNKEKSNLQDSIDKYYQLGYSKNRPFPNKDTEKYAYYNRMLDNFINNMHEESLYSKSKDWKKQHINDDAIISGNKFISRFNNIHNASGNIGLFPTRSVWNYLSGKSNSDRATFNIITNNANSINNLNEALAEMSHPIQSKYGKNNGLSEFTKTKLLYEDSSNPVSGRYGRHDSLEWETHSVFQPVLEKYLQDEQFGDSIDNLKGGLEKFLEQVPEKYKYKYTPSPKFRTDHFRNFKYKPLGNYQRHDKL